MTEATQSNSQTQRWFSTKQAAHYLGVTTRALEGYVRRGQLTPYKPFGRWMFDVKEIDAVVRSSKS